MISFYNFTKVKLCVNCMEDIYTLLKKVVIDKHQLQFIIEEDDKYYENMLNCFYCNTNINNVYCINYGSFIELVENSNNVSDFMEKINIEINSIIYPMSCICYT